MPKKYFIIILLSVLILPTFVYLFLNGVSAQAASVLQRGNSSGSVKELQNILKTDPSVYPEGLSTGYFGPATENAVKRLQARYGLAQTGVVDSATAQIIFPNITQLKIISPNGGETWDKSVNHTISWQVTVGPLSGPGQPTGLQTPFYSNASIDLIRSSDSSFYYHIATVDLFQAQYNWKIPNTIPNASDYMVKISAGSAVPCSGRLYDSTVPCPLTTEYYPQYSYSDTSDNVFSITGTDIPNDAVARIKAMLEQIQQAINNLQNQLNSLRQLVGSL